MQDSRGKFRTVALALTWLALCAAPLAAWARTPAVEEVSATDLLAQLKDGGITSEALVRAYQERIERISRTGPRLNAFISLNPDARAEARKLDAERKTGTLRGPLHGLPIVVKDNVETLDRMPTTSGSLALADNFTGRDSPAIAQLRAAGAIILGKANLTEWANARSPSAIAGWSAMGGVTRNPYVLDRSACGSSSGTGAAVAASLAAVGVATETRGSIVCPASSNGVVGLKPSIGLISATHVVPNSIGRDTLGPMGRSVRDVALLFSFMVDADPYRQDFVAALSPDALRGVRLGVLRPPTMQKLVADRFAIALARLQSAGAELVDIEMPNLDNVLRAHNELGKYELKPAMNAYLATLPASVKVRTVADLIAFNKAHAAQELSLFGQETLEATEKEGRLDRPAYLAARATAVALGGEAGLAVMLKASNVAAIVMPSYGPARSADPVGVDPTPSYNVSNMVAIAGYPHLSVPMGLVRGMPVGLSFIGPAFSDGALLRFGHAFEATGALREAPKYLQRLPAEDVLDPQR